MLDGKIHVLGGGNDVSTLAKHLTFDPKKNRWTKRAPLQRPEGSVAAVAFRGRIYAIGGRSGFDDYGDAFVYDAVKNSWSDDGQPDRRALRAGVTGPAAVSAAKWPRVESNHRAQLRRLPLCPLSYGAREEVSAGGREGGLSPASIDNVRSQSTASKSHGSRDSASRTSTRKASKAAALSAELRGRTL